MEVIGRIVQTALLAGLGGTKRLQARHDGVRGNLELKTQLFHSLELPFVHKFVSYMLKLPAGSLENNLLWKLETSERGLKHESSDTATWYFMLADKPASLLPSSLISSPLSSVVSQYQITKHHISCIPSKCFSRCPQSPELVPKPEIITMRHSQQIDPASPRGPLGTRGERHSSDYP